MANFDVLSAEISGFLRYGMGDLYEWSAPSNHEPIGPQDSSKFDFYANQVKALTVTAGGFAIEHKKEIVDGSFLGRLELNIKWRNQFGDDIDRLRRAMPRCYEGGFGIVPDQKAYKTYCSMEYWTTKEAFWLRLGLVPPLDNETKLDRLFPAQSDFVSRRREVFQRRWPDKLQFKEKVTPSEFCQWALEKELDCPSLMFECVSKAHNVKLQRNQKRDSPKDKSSVSAKELATLQKIIIGMAVKHYKYDPSKRKSEVPAKIESTLGLMGISVTAETIRTHLKRASVHLGKSDSDS